MLALRAIPAIYHAFRCPCYRVKISVCLSVSSIPTGQQSKHTAGIEGKEDGSVYSKIPSGHPLPHSGGHRSSQVGTHVRRCPRLRLLRIRWLCMCGGATSPLFLFWQRNSNSRIVRVSNTKIELSCGGLLASMRPLSTERHSRFDSGRGGTREQRRFGWWWSSPSTLRSSSSFSIFLLLNGTLVSFLKVKVHPWLSSGIIYPLQLRWQPVAAAAVGRPRPVAAGRRLPAAATAAAAAGWC